MNTETIKNSIKKVELSLKNAKNGMTDNGVTVEERKQALKELYLELAKAEQSASVEKVKSKYTKAQMKYEQEKNLTRLVYRLIKESKGMSYETLAYETKIITCKENDINKELKKLFDLKYISKIRDKYPTAYGKVFTMYIAIK